uniref:1-acylglycerol-3-phosphate O-acyltransferase ABHD5 n=1 Tax=Cyprinus carpio TaxID=7962 RepID=A0A8C1QXU3_CYPCA
PSWCPTSFLIPIQSIQHLYCIFKSSSDLSASGLQHHQVSLVLLHGFGGGVGLWVKNLPALAQEGRAFFALDMLGFGHSSRPTIGRDAKDAEELKHLVLVEPWGFTARPNVKEHWVPIWIKVFGAAMNPFNPLGPLRLAGPLGPLLLQLLRVDFKQKYDSVFAEDTVSDYHVNAQTSHTHGLSTHDGLEMISPCLPLIFIYGSRSRIDGLYVFADQSEDFNQAVLKICNNIRHIINGEEYNQ